MGYDVMAEEYTAIDGTFEIKGKAFAAQPHYILKIYHDCDDGMKAGQRKFNFFIPSRYASHDENAEPYEFGELNLETRFKHNEERQEIVDKRRMKKTRSVNVTIPKNSESDESPEDRIEPW